MSQNYEIDLAIQYLQKADSLGIKSQYSKAILLTKRALNLYQRKVPVAYNDLVKTYRLLGYYLRKNGNYEEGEKYLIKAVNLGETKLPVGSEELIKSLNGYGILLLAKGEYIKSIKVFTRALNLCQRQNCTELAIQFNNLGIAHENLGDNEAARKYYKLALDYNQKAFGRFSLQASDNYINLGTMSYNEGQLDLALSYFDTSLLIYDRILPFEHEDYAALYNNYGVVFNRKGDYKTSQEFLNRALRNYEYHLGHEHPDVANAYSNSGSLFFERGDLDRALTYFQKAWSIRSQQLGEKHHVSARTCISLGNVYLEKKDYESSYYWLGKGMNGLLRNPESPLSELVEARNGFGNYFEKLGNYKDALLHYSEGLRLSNLNADASGPIKISSLTKIGKIYLLTGEYTTARSFIERALSISVRIYGRKHQDIAALYRMLANSYPDDLICAMEYGDSAMVAINYKPIRARNFEGVVTHLELLKILRDRGILHLGFYEDSKDLSQLYLADNVFSSCFQLIDFIKSTLEEPGSRQALMDNFFSVYEQGIIVKHLLSEATGKTEYREEAFVVAEKSNATLLLEALRSAEAEQFAELPDSLLDKERLLKIDLAFLEKQRFEKENQKQTDQQELQKLDNTIFQLKKAYNELLELYRVSYPKYFELKFSPGYKSVGEVQKELLQKGQNLISYFIGENNIFIFVLDKNKIAVKHIPKNFPLEAWVEEFRRSLNGFNPAIQNAVFLNQKFAAIGFELYDVLFKPIENDLTSEEIIVIPGGILGYLPFDALLSQNPEDFNNFDSFDYLLKKFNISYSYSATFSIELKKQRRSSGSFLVFAPTYTNSDTSSGNSNLTELPALKYNLAEAKSVHNIMGGHLYTGNNATSTNFLKEAPDARALHLAAHGMANDLNSEFSFLAFTQNPGETGSNLLFVKNLYNLRLKAAMVVLSACETGIGELQRGEGIISLARGFSYAGAASIITTLWRIDDKASADIMLSFYRNLKDGNSKNSALRKAKLEYLAKSKGSNYSHPLFWAAFIPIGSMEPIQSEALPWWAWTIILISGTLGALIGSRYLRNRASN